MKLFLNHNGTKAQRIFAFLFSPRKRGPETNRHKVPAFAGKALALCLCAVVVQFFSFPAHAADKQQTYDRIIQTHTIRCAYFPFSPNLIIDPNTGKKSGIFYDLTEEIGKRLGLKIDWVEEVGYGVIIEGFKTGRYDMFCNNVWPTPERASQASFTTPLYYSPVGIFVRANDVRFDKDYKILNDPTYTMAVRDGDISDSITKVFLPKARTISVPEQSGVEQPLLEVSTGKADAVITEPIHIMEFNRSSDKKLKNLVTDKPIKYFPNTYMFGENEPQFQQMLNVTINELIAEGYIDHLLNKYLPEKEYPKAVFPVAKPYEVRK